MKATVFASRALSVGDRGLLVLVAGRLDAGEARRAVLGEIGRDLHLTNQREHVGSQPRIEQDRRVDLPGSGKCLRFVENGRQRVETDHESWERRLRHRKRHGMDPCPAS